MKDCLQRGEAPYASHLLYTQAHVLNDLVPEERKLGMNAGFEWKKAASKTVVYTDLGITSGMEKGIAISKKLGQEIEYREIGFPYPIKTVYLAGAMECVPDEGLAWRKRYAQNLEEHFDIKSIIPNNEEADIIPPGTDMKRLKKESLYDYREVMIKIRNSDLKFVQSVDAIICRWDGERIAGTVGEAQHADIHAVPFYLICKRPYYELPGWMVACATEIYPEFSCFMMDLADIIFNQEK